MSERPRHPSFRFVFSGSVSLALLVATCATAGSSGDRVSSALVPTGQRLAPAGKSLTFFGRPLDLAVSSGGTIAIKNSHGIVFVDAATSRVMQDLRLTRDRVKYPLNLGGNGLIGIAWNRAGTTVWSADGFGLLRSATRAPSGAFAWDPDIELPGPSGVFRDATSHELDASIPTGIALSADDATVYVALSRNNTVAAVDAATRTIRSTVPTGTAPFALLRAGEKLYVSNLGGVLPALPDVTADAGGTRVRVDPRTGIANSGTVSAIDLGAWRPIAQIEVGLHPGALALSHDGTHVFVANANGDSIGVINAATDTVERTIHLPLQSGFGAAPDALAVSPLDGNLYVAEGGDNRILILDATSFQPVAQIQTGWYPDGVAFARNGALYATSLKGLGSRGVELGFARTDLGFRLFVPLGSNGYNVYDYAGLLQSFSPNAPAREKPSESSRSFLSNAALVEPAYRNASAVPVPVRSGQRSVFKHVIFIIKENHTYDDYLGDIRGANGDPKLCVFPERISPNHHALAARFGVFDNLYVNGTMSADGHQWTDEADATDYVERNTASWARSYPSDGTDPLAYASTGFIWQRVLDAHLTFRDYGEFTTAEPTFTPRNSTWSQFYADRAHGTHTVAFTNGIDIRPLVPYVDPAYPGFTLRISDQARADEFLREFRRFARTGALPNFVLMQLGNDHTAGTDPGYPVPTSAVADNDLALGRIVDAVSHSRFWRDTVIFVVEDDAQNGFDHVDGHRTMALAISAYNRRHTVDSHFYNQTSILRTIEAILGLKPLTQFDGLAVPIVAPFGLGADLAPYSARPNNVPLDRLNPKAAALSGMERRYALALQGMNFDAPDSAGQELLSASLRFYLQHRHR